MDTLPHHHWHSDVVQLVGPALLEQPPPVLLGLPEEREAAIAVGLGGRLLMDFDVASTSPITASRFA
eukprot:CAMPEP_0172570758 /NCGR_PEP_ID=MMETSP1067-20121228/128731_1 /TAXON_ID=265564 ORGANISM="Thalassiosira punctigera, Strain Tpunct2005C2" /NCGR_SAMPLE_ID=MMETSP1067 /ASSEMBLY_ACC=CAM_ASM_000444 /LENGTH=66 /DNA_ID=CAMNT_0013362923 /DNA_START=398 /DNA_END=595 /DNA_ORIENTATION=-